MKKLFSSSPILFFASPHAKTIFDRSRRVSSDHAGVKDISAEVSILIFLSVN